MRWETFVLPWNEASFFSRQSNDEEACLMINCIS
ncbi:hypothetical protein T06_4416 [Trichinella sp. T6]|nr:hypothetical protein T06_4416 [Trichinella sp. T6]